MVKQMAVDIDDNLDEMKLVLRLLPQALVSTIKQMRVVQLAAILAHQQIYEDDLSPEAAVELMDEILDTRISVCDAIALAEILGISTEGGDPFVGLTMQFSFVESDRERIHNKFFDTESYNLMHDALEERRHGE